MKIVVPKEGINARVYSDSKELAVVKEILGFREKVFLGRKQVPVRGGEMRSVQEWQYVKRSMLRGNLFLAGLLPRVARGLEKKGISCEVVREDGLEKIVASKPHLHGISLRDYQLDVVDKIVKFRRGVVVYPTGSGKTVMMGAVISSFKELNFLVVVQKLDLLNQTVENLSEMLGEEVGCVSGKEERWESITVSTIQVMTSRRYKIPFIGGLIVDEVHHAGSPTYRKVLNKICSQIRVGFTATEAFIPRKHMQIEGIFGPVIATMPYEDLGERGLLAKGTVIMYEVPVNVHTYTMSASNWNGVYEAGIVYNQERNAKIAVLATDLVRGGKKVLVIVNRIEHGRLLAGMMGENAKFVYGGTETEDRAKVKTIFKEKGGQVVVSTNIFDEGMDFPELDVVLLARGWESPIATIQSAGRGTRVSKGKNSFFVIDFYDRTHKVLKRHSVSRMNSYKRKGWEVVSQKETGGNPLHLVSSTV